MTVLDLPLFRKQLRNRLYLNNGADVTLDLIDALCTAVGVSSPVELSLLPAFRGRHYSAVYQAIAHFPLQRQDLLPLLLSFEPPPNLRPFHLYSVDVKPVARPYAHCLRDRHFVHRSTPVPGQKPITVGHAYSLLAYLPEKASPHAPPWAPIYDAQRVPSDTSYIQIAEAQCRDLIRLHPKPSEALLFVADNGFARRAFLYPLVAEEGSHVLVRLRSNQVVYGPPSPKEKGKPGRPRLYGLRFALNDPTTWPQPDLEKTRTTQLRNGRPVQIHLKVWYDMRMRGTRDYPMHRCPFTLLQVTLTTLEGRPLYRRPLWLACFGPKRQAWAPEFLYEAYRQRFDQEHAHRFLTQHLLAEAYQTPDTDHEERWWRLVTLAYFQLWLARPLAQARWRPWEKHLAKKAASAPCLSPTQVQRDFWRILSEMGTPARRLKPRGNPRGRRPGQRLPPRPRYRIVHKGQKTAG